MRCRAGLVSLIYKKGLVLSNDERSGRATGDIVNLQSTDATRIGDFCTYGQVAWSGLFQITLAFISLYQLLGWTMFVGVGVMIVSMPLTAAIARSVFPFRLLDWTAPLIISATIDIKLNFSVNK
jgi:ATP-binding cassette subfamily C (CFTR/MRP) protein 1